MSYPNAANPYGFDDFLAWRENCDYYAQDPFAQKAVRVFTGAHAAEVDAAAREISGKVSFRWRKMAESIAWPEKRPWMMHYDGHGNRIDRIVRPHETEVMEQEVFGEALFADKTHPWVRFIKMYLIYQNGEACISCPLTCTEGMVAVLERFAETPEIQSILAHCKEGRDGRFGIGAQYLSEIQGGSDVKANLLEARQENGHWRLYGTKFFCSATHADYAMVTAKPAGSEQVGLFVMPSWLPGDKARERRNHFTIDRIKWKMGTSELTTAELTLDGALAYPVGPLERGLANMVGIVLTYSRLTVGLSGAASMMRAWREAARYCDFREAFGFPIGRMPMVAGQLATIEKAAKRTLAGAFRLNADILSLPGGLAAAPDAQDTDDLKQRRFNIRELIMLQKMATSFDAPDALRLAMSLFGGHGVMEDFSALPRLYRDAAVNELWEGPRNVLLAQIHRDLLSASSWYAPEVFVANILAGAPEDLVKELQQEIKGILSGPGLFEMSPDALEVCARWDRFCHRLFHAYQDVAAAMVEKQG
ncbi:acyl-CoA dehydrogenase family protein [Desulfatitalea alkaliphila]|uniref:Acyl-CoA dehydrogenase family protein n=1 Tax=Desulfatitalea alkaliphila TaxID=2929485 RepID=A0AA41UQG8_9BACT|nr:acyl-CoA dehydrogenase family protein [Desulfatitalea alkaliphila]MCJ8501358.1 acyl-CoA dehydrogenase family protein [Desulfatitalea alkaliphila]